jgi:phosphoglycolate phosphatase-like HAD superfamily hydrolase
MRKTTLITDFDNTLYDWFHTWYLSFNAMLNEIERISEVPRKELIRDIRRIHQKYGTSEYSFLIEELPIIKNKFAGRDVMQIFDSAVHAYRSARKSSLKLYDGVSETLAHLKSTGVVIVIYTESLGYYTNFRVRRLELESVVDFIYSPPDHELPSTHPSGRNGFQESGIVSPLRDKHRFVPEGVVKPNPEVLLDIIREVGRLPSECIYLGDSNMKDVAMAQDAGVMDVLAGYGAVQHQEEYDLLRQVSHWPDADVQREQQPQPRTPTHSINEFREIKRFFEGSEPEQFGK